MNSLTTVGSSDSASLEVGMWLDAGGGHVIEVVEIHGATLTVRDVSRFRRLWKRLTSLAIRFRWKLYGLLPA